MVVAAEGCTTAGLELPTLLDPSGNRELASAAHDVGRSLQYAIEAHFARRGLPLTLKYIDPSYMIRAQRARGQKQIDPAGALWRHVVESTGQPSFTAGAGGAGERVGWHGAWKNAGA